MNTELQVATHASRLRRLVAERKLREAETRGEVSCYLASCVAVWRDSMADGKISAGERRKSAQALARFVQGRLEPDSEATNVVIDQRTAEVHIHNGHQPPDAAATARVLEDLGIRLPDDGGGPTEAPALPPSPAAG